MTTIGGIFTAIILSSISTAQVSIEVSTPLSESLLRIDVCVSMMLAFLLVLVQSSLVRCCLILVDGTVSFASFEVCNSGSGPLVDCKCCCCFVFKDLVLVESFFYYFIFRINGGFS